MDLFDTLGSILKPYKLADDPDPNCKICQETEGIYRHEYDMYLCDDCFDFHRDELEKIIEDE